MRPCHSSCQAPLSMELRTQAYRNGLRFPTPGDLPDHWPRDQICVFCVSYIGRRIPYHCTTWEAHGMPTQSVQSLIRVDSAATWTVACQSSLPSPTRRACSNSCPSSRWCYLNISSSVVAFCSCLQSFPASGSFPKSQFFPSGGQCIGVSSWASVLPMNTQDWPPLGWTCWISLLSKRLSRVFSNTTVQKHQLFSAQLSL